MLVTLDSCMNWAALHRFKYLEGRYMVVMSGKSLRVHRRNTLLKTMEGATQSFSSCLDRSV